MGDDFKNLEMRLAKIESLLKQQQAPELHQISADEWKAYQKVNGALSSLGDWNCGINECRPVVCLPRVCLPPRVCIPPKRCINECICGPCNACWSGGGLGQGSFSGFGD